MGWSELRRLPNEYNAEFRSIDENLIELLQKRKALANGKRYFPSQEIMQEWTAIYDMEISQISWLIHSLNEGRHTTMPNGPGELINVLPIMKKSTVDGFDYQLTHSMQHENGSIVFLEIMSIETDNQTGGHIRPQLQLEVRGDLDYNVSRNGSQGGSGQTQLRYLVTPKLPNNINEVSFALSPYAIPMETPPKEIILNKEVHFE